MERLNYSNKILIMAGLFFWSFTSMVFAQDKIYDYLIQDALVFDGVSTKGVNLDVAISGDKIEAVGELDPEQAKKVISAKGLVLAPGFIDTHTHADFNSLIYPKLPNKLLQGVTTEVVGNCGMSAAPVYGLQEKEIHEVWAREGVQIPKKIVWKDYGEYAEEIEKKGMLTNFTGLVGHGNLRTSVMGLAARQATPDEINQMKSLLDQSMQQGAVGISYGLVYLPGIYANQDELIELCKVAAQYDGVCAFHMRSESSKLIEAAQEALTIGEKANAKIQISHLKAAGKDNWGKISEVFKLIEEARKRGAKVEADVYPYTASFAELGVILPDEFFELENRNQYFSDPDHRISILEFLQEHYKQKNTNWEAVVIAAIPNRKYRKYEGKSIQQIATEEKKKPEEVVLDLLVQTQFQVSAFYFSQNQQVVDEIVTKPYVTIGSDSIADGSTRPHPRAYGAFPKIFREYVREKKWLELGDAIKKMTSVAADHFGLEGRGRIQPGAYADLVLFDLKKIKDEANYEHSNVLSKGVEWVYINGQPVVKQGRFQNLKKGKVLKRQGLPAEKSSGILPPSTKEISMSEQERKNAVTFKNNPITLIGPEIKAGDKAPNFKVLANDLTEVTLDKYKGKTLVVSVVPSLDTPVCDLQTKRFNEEAGKLPSNVAVVTVSMDLPFAQKRWCGASQATNVQTLSDHREASFGKSYGILIKELRLLSRGIFIIGPDQKVQYVEYVKEVTQHPDYDKALNALKAGTRA